MFALNSRDLKSFDMENIYAISEGFSEVMIMAHPIILLSREK
jgi:hypothetical protein